MITVKKIFSKTGPIAAKLDRYEKRDAQIALALAVEEAIDAGDILLGEAGTGTGKTLAYLAPAIASGCRTIISTGTKNLQEQIFFKDIEFLKEALGSDIRAAYLKGQDNYLCLYRLEKFVSSPASLSYEPSLVQTLIDWSHRTQTGDRMELDSLADDAGIWMDVCSTQDTHTGRKCPFSEECFVSKARRKAAVSDLVVVNHHLYFADLATRMRGGAILPSHDVVVFDEAHLVEDIATEFFSTKVSSARIERTCKDAMGAIKRAAFNDDTYEEDREKIYIALIRLGKLMFDKFRGALGKSNIEGISTSQVEAYHKLDSVLESFQRSMQYHEGKDDDVDNCVMRIDEIRADLCEILDGYDKHKVYWVDSRPRSVVLGASPIDISSYFKEQVLLNRDTVVMCSATLTTGNSFSFFKSRLGIDMDTRELIVDSPFDYPRQSRIYIPAHLPDPRNESFLTPAAEEILQLLKLSNGGAFVLCTSNKNMNAFYSILNDEWDGVVLKQGHAPKFQLVNQFREQPNTVLVATTSFWQGVDIPGHALRMVIIDKLPFASPSDPITAARIDDLKSQNRQPFMEYQVPSAALVLKQGFGRLIRTAYDTGVVAILDSRIRTKRYGRIFLNSLPNTPATTDFAELKKFWNEL